METYAVIETGGKQYRVTPGKQIEIERLDAEAGEDVTLETVLALSDGTNLHVGAPFVEGAKVVLTVEEEFRGPKVVNFKKKRRKGYSRKVGHRQNMMRAKVKEIAGKDQ